jgi:hypothetical protein
LSTLPLAISSPRGFCGRFHLLSPETLMLATDPLSALTTFSLEMLGLSMATERVTETVKQWVFPSLNVGNARYAAIVQTLAIASGITVTALSGIDPLTTLGVQAAEATTSAHAMTWVVNGLLASGGSAVWNHILDILRAAKVQKEQLAQQPQPVAQTTVVAAAVAIPATVEAVAAS